jgi:fructose 1,6-bisphosphate aldolase/phosphatase
VKITVSAIKADIGGLVGHSAMHPAILEEAQAWMAEAVRRQLVDNFVTHCGDDLELIMTHTHGVGSQIVHKLAWDTFNSCAEVSRKLGLHGPGQDLLVDEFTDQITGTGPGVAEMEFEERSSEPLVIFMADKTSAGAWNLPLYKIFADPFNTAGLVISPKLHVGFRFEVHDIKEGKRIFFDTPEESYNLLALIGAPSRFVIKHVFAKSGEIAAVSSTDKVNLIAGRYVGKDDPVMVVRAQGWFPAVGEILEPFSTAFIVEGWMRGSHHGPLMPVPLKDARCIRFDGPPRVIALGFQLKSGKLIGPVDMFDDPSYDEARREANQIASYLRRHGPFEPHRLPLGEMEYTTLPGVMKKLADRWETI